MLRQQAWRLITEICRQEDQKVSAGWWHRWERLLGWNGKLVRQQDHWKGEDVCKREGVLFLHSKEKKQALLPAVARKDVFCYLGELGRGSRGCRRPSGVFCLTSHLTRGTSPVMDTMSHPSPRAPLASVEVLVPQSSLQVASRWRAMGTVQIGPFDTVIRGLGAACLIKGADWD